MQVFVQLLTGNYIIVEVNNEDTINTLFQKIAEKEDIHPEQLRVIFRGKQLYPDKTIADYEITHGSTIYLYMRLLGGH